LSRKEKIEILCAYKSFANEKLPLKVLHPNVQGDWLSNRNEFFDAFIPLGEKDTNSDKQNALFNPLYSYGIITARDIWVWNFNENILKANVQTTIDFYSEELRRFQEEKKSNPKLKAKTFITYNLKKISWDNRRLIGGIDGNKSIKFDPENIRVGFYRPYCKQSIYFSLQLCHSLYLQKNYFPTSDSKNILICVSPSSNDGLAILISNSIVDYHYNGDTQCFPLYYYEERQKQNKFDAAGESELIRRDGVSDFILEQAKKIYGKTVSKEDIFYYVYGFLHSPEYRTMFANDLKKMLPRLPLIEDVRDFWKFSKAGRKLADLHINYESVPAYDGVTVTGADSGFYTVEKMRFPKTKKGQKDTIIFNSGIVIENIPEKAYEYVVNGKSAIEWIMERYQVTVHKDSGIRNDPNDWAEESGNPRYILDLLLSIVNVSVQTVDIVGSLPKVKFES